MKLPDGYVEVTSGGTRAFAWHGAVLWITRTLEEHGSLRAWAEAADTTRALTGRGSALALDAGASGPDARSGWVVRPYLRGGAVAALLHDRYARLGPSRAERELRASCAARDRGVPTPAVVAGAVYPAGVLHYRADLVTELVPDSVDLAVVLFEVGRSGHPEPLDALHAAGRLISRAAAAGIRHVDLNARNIVLRAGEDGTEAYLVDLDRCVVRDVPRAGDGQRMRTRLERSLHKLSTAYERPLDTACWDALDAGASGT